MGKTKKDRIFDFQITKLTKKGNGLGTAERENAPTITAEIPFSIPGDTVSARVFNKRGGVYNGKLEQVIEASPGRIPPRCIHFGECGGCRLQNIDYKNQTAFKENLVKDLFKNILTSDTNFLPILTCEDPWHYRNKMEFSFSTDSANNKYLGLIIAGSRGKVFNLTECHIANTWFADGVNSVREWWDKTSLDAFHMMKHTGSLRNLTLREGRRTGDRMAILTVSGNPDYAMRKEHLESFVTALRKSIEPNSGDSKLSIFLRIQQSNEGMSTHFYEMLLHGPDHIREILNISINNKETTSLQFTISPSAFFQTNTTQAEKLYSAALTLANISRDAVVYDLYCGTGALGLCIAKHVKQVVGIEISPEATLDAKANAARNACDNVTVIAGAVRHMLGQLKDLKIPPPDVVMVDPPRPGLDPLAMKHLLELAPAKILYISCNPATQATNVAELMQHGYNVDTIQPIDQFPQTYHVENIVVLTKVI